MLLAHADPIQHTVVVAICLSGTIAYAWWWSTAARRARRAMISWAVAVFGVLVATMPTVEDWSERSFSGHMVQHLLLIAVVAPAFVVALEPVVFRRHRARRPHRALDRPWAAPVAAAMFVGTLLVSHLTGIYDAALGSQPLHEIEHLAYLVTAIALWVALRSGATRRDAAAPFGRIVAILGVIAGMAVLGLVLATAAEPLMPTYAAHQGVDAALRDQRRAAALMWIGGMLTTLPLLVLAFWRWAAHEEAAARRTEHLLDARVRVDAESDSATRTGSETATHS